MRADEVVAIAAGQKCLNAGCECHRTAQTQKGKTHCPVTSRHKNGDANPALLVSIKGDTGSIDCMVGCDFQSIIDHCIEAGMKVDDFAPRLSFLFTCPKRFFSCSSIPILR